MQELIRLVVNRTGLSHERATVVVKITLDFIKAKLPAPVASQIDAALRGSDPSPTLKIHLGNTLIEK
jgi:hypothetical protein